MTSEFGESIVTRVLSYRSKAPDGVRRKLDSAINDAVRVPQFRQSTKAPNSYLLKPVLRKLFYSESLLSTVLKVWSESHHDLHDKVKEHLLSRNIPLAYPDFSAHQLRSYWSYDEWNFEWGQILEKHDNLDRDEVGLMLCYVSGKMPTSREIMTMLPDETLEGGRSSEEAQVEQASTLNTNILVETRSYLEHLPAESPAWKSEIPGFLSFVTEILSAEPVSI